jgi:hypothetical protein
MEWPKAWLEAAEIKFYGGKHYREAHFDDYSSPSDILDSLNEIGALKEPPQPRKFYVCVKHNSMGAHAAHQGLYCKYPECAPDNTVCFGLGVHEWIQAQEII